MDLTQTYCHQYKSFQSQVEQFRSQRNLLSIEKIEEYTTKLKDFIIKEEITVSNVNKITEKIIFFLQNGADINILQENILSSIIKHYRILLNEKINSDKIELFFDLLNEISILSDEESFLIAQKNQIPEIIQSILKSTGEDHILFLLNKSICNFIYKKPLTANLFYREKLIGNLYKFYNDHFCFNMHEKSVTNLYTIFQCFEVVIIIISSNPKDNQQIFESFIHRINFSLIQILKKERCEDDDTIYHYQLEMVSFQLVKILENKEISMIVQYLNIELLNNLLKVLGFGGEVSKNILKIFDIILFSSSICFILIKNECFYNFRPDFNDVDVFQIYCSIWIKVIKEVTNEEKCSKGKQQFILKIMKKEISTLLQYFLIAGQISQNKKILSLLFISFTYFDDKNIIEPIATFVPNIIERIANELNEENSLEISKGLFNLVKYYNCSETLQKIISKDLEKHLNSIIGKLNALPNEKVLQLNDLKIIKIDSKEKDENKCETKQDDQNYPNDQNDESIEEKIQYYFEKKKELYDAILSLLEDQEENNVHAISGIIERKHIVENKVEFEILLKLLNSFAHNHHRCANFIKKIQNIIGLYTAQIKNTFSNSEIYNIFQNNKLILLYLFENKIIKKDEQFSCSEINDSIENSDEKIHEGENDSTICTLIRNDSVEQFVAYVNQRNICLASKIKPSIFETNSFLIGKTPTLIEYSAFFGAIQIFRFLLMNEIKLTPSLWIYSIHSQCPELIHILEEYQVQPEDKTYKECLIESIKCHHNHFANYIMDNYFNDNSDQNDYNNSLLSYAFQNNNFDFIYQFCNNEFILFYLCQYNYIDLVKLLAKDKKLDINKEIILNIIFF